MKVLLACVLIIVLVVTHEPPIMQEVRRRNRKLARALGQWPSAIVSLRPDGPELGWNIGKGWSMAVCTRGSIDSIMNVIVHEMAHTAVDVYDHSESFVKSRDNVSKINNTI